MLKYQKVGGIHFLKLGRVRLSYCLARKPAARPAPAAPWAWDWIDSSLFGACLACGLGLGLWL